jgi:uncharacterized lipoprotein YajG
VTLLKKSATFAALTILLALLLTQCASSPEVVTETVLPPAIEFPDPPAPYGVEYGDGTVTIPAELWVQIAEYYIDVEATEQKYRAIREEYDGGR